MEAFACYDKPRKLAFLNLKLCSEQIMTMTRIGEAKNFCSYLDQSGIDYQLCIKHPEVRGCGESEEYYKRFDSYLDFDYSICKHILVKERKGEKRVYLIIVDQNKKVDLNALKDMLECKKLEFVNEEEMRTLLNTNPGNVSIFNMINDKEEKVNLVIDYELLSKQSLAFHPLYNGMSLFLTPDNMVKFLVDINRKANIIDVPEKDTQKEIEEKVKVISYV